MTFQLRELVLENHRRFIERVASAGQVWGLKSVSGWAVCDSTEAEAAVDVMPFWSDRAYAARAAVDDWSEYEPTSIPLSLFIERWLKGMSADGTLVGTNWDGANCGLEIHPARLARELLVATGESDASDD